MNFIEAKDSFEEQFPSLKVKVIWEKEGFPNVRSNISYELWKEIQKCCVDKQRLKKILTDMKGITCDHTMHVLGFISAVQYLEKELGLDNTLFGMTIKEGKNLKKREFKLE